jgi:hypothetical protein
MQASHSAISAGLVHWYVGIGDVSTAAQAVATLPTVCMDTQRMLMEIQVRALLRACHLLLGTVIETRIARASHLAHAR